MYKLFFFFLISVLITVSCQTGTDKNNTVAIDSLSVDELTKRIQNSPDDGSFIFARAKKYLGKGQTDEAIADLNNAVTKEGRKAEYYLMLADLYLVKGQSGNAKDALENCAKIYPKNTEAILKLAQLHFFVKQYKQALNYLNQAQAVDENIAKIYFIRGLVLEESGDTANAIINFQISTEKNPNYYEAFNILGLRYTDKKDSLALSYFKNALKVKPGSAEVYYNIGMFYQKLGRYTRAISQYEELVTKIDSSYKYAYFNIGYIHLQYMKDYGKAIVFFMKATQADKNYFEAWTNLGVCYEKLKDYQKAKECFRQSLAVNSDYELAQNGLKRVEKKVR